MKGRIKKLMKDVMAFVAIFAFGVFAMYMGYADAAEEQPVDEPLTERFELVAISPWEVKVECQKGDLGLAVILTGFGTKPEENLVFATADKAEAGRHILVEDIQYGAWMLTPGEGEMVAFTAGSKVVHIHLDGESGGVVVDCTNGEVSTEKGTFPLPYVVGEPAFR